MIIGSPTASLKSDKNTENARCQNLIGTERDYEFDRFVRSLFSEILLENAENSQHLERRFLRKRHIQIIDTSGYLTVRHSLPLE
jgi:hypothetical protein